MSLFKNVELPDNPTMNAVRRYLEAQHNKDFAGADTFLADNVVFRGLVLKAEGRDAVAGQIQGFLQQAVDYIELEAVTQVAEDDGQQGPDRVLALYWFKLKPCDAPQILCDHLTVSDGKIERIENVFDLKKLPPM